LGFPCNISATDGANDFKFGTQLGFAKAHDKVTRRKKGTHAHELRELAQIWGFLSIFTQWLKLATSNLVHSLGLPKPIKHYTQRKKWGWPWAKGASQHFGVPYNISATPGSRDFKFGTQLGFAKIHHKTTP